MTTLRRTRAILLVAVLLTALVAACGGDDDDDAGTDSGTTASTAADEEEEEEEEEEGGGEATGIVIEGFAFSGLEATAGETATVTNNDNTNHTFTADDGSFDTGEIGGGESAEFTAPEAGIYAVHCEIHSTMKGELTVS